MGLAAKLQQAGSLAGSFASATGNAPGAHGGFGAAGMHGAPAGYPQAGHQQPGGYPGAKPTGAAAPYAAYPGAGQASHGQGGYPPAGQVPGQTGGYPQAGQTGGYPQAGQTGGYPPVGQQPQQHGYGAAMGAGAAALGVGGAAVGAYGAHQSHQQGAQLGGAYPPPSGGGFQQALQSKVQATIAANQLQSFYPPQALQQVMNKLNSIDFRSLAARWNMPVEMALDLAALALYDIVIYADDSGSMVFEENGSRVDDLKLIMSRAAEVGTLFDDNGIVVRFMNCGVEGNGVRDAGAASALLQSVQFNGLTPLGTQLNNKVVQPFLATGVQQRNLSKPILVIVITDGEPAGEAPNTVVNVIKQAKNMVASSQYGPGAIAFEFAQVGKDQGAQRFLATLDKDPTVGKMVDATSYYELEAEEYQRKGITLTPDLWLVKLMVGAIDPSYDEQD